VIEPGKAYWVKTSGPGQLFYDGLTTPKPKVSAEEALGTYSTSITITDRNGHSGNLYVYDADKIHVDGQRYAAPPLPPAGAFDARFASNRIAEPYRRTDSPALKSYSVHLTGTEYPVTIALGSSEFASNVIVSEIRDGKSVQEHVLPPNSSLTITDKNVSSLLFSLVNGKAAPTAFELSQNYPNPFNPTTRLTVSVPFDSHVDVSVYNLIGEKIATLLEGNVSAGYHTVEWNGAGAHGTVSPSGIYFVRMTAGSYSAIRRMMFLK
jgi:hypothetical protein